MRIIILFDNYMAIPHAIRDCSINGFRDVVDFKRGISKFIDDNGVLKVEYDTINQTMRIIENEASE